MNASGGSRIAWAISERERRIMRQLSRRPGKDDPDEDLHDFMGAGHADR